MHKTVLLTLSLLAPFVVPGAANAGPKITDKNYFPNEVHAQSGHGVKQSRKADWRRAQAHATRTVVPSKAKQKVAPTGQYQGGPKLPPAYW
ncbi:MAG: hypothetical protein K2Z80_33590 [Xanthobacteraceae bacterium]|nr:hypothetical protein [Xanthobacteraceae bacterium]